MRPCSFRFDPPQYVRVYFWKPFGLAWLAGSGKDKRGNCKGGNLDLVDLVDLVDLFNSAEIYKNTRRIKETSHGGALRPCGAQPKAAPVVSLFLLVFLYISAELNKLTKSTKSQLPPLQLPPFTPR